MLILTAHNIQYVHIHQPINKGLEPYQIGQKLEYALDKLQVHYMVNRGT